MDVASADRAAAGVAAAREYTELILPVPAAGQRHHRVAGERHQRGRPAVGRQVQHHDRVGVVAGAVVGADVGQLGRGGTLPGVIADEQDVQVGSRRCSARLGRRAVRERHHGDRAVSELRVAQAKPLTSRMVSDSSAAISLAASRSGPSQRRLIGGAGRSSDRWSLRGHRVRLACGFCDPVSYRTGRPVSATAVLDLVHRRAGSGGIDTGPAVPSFWANRLTRNSSIIQRSSASRPARPGRRPWPATRPDRRAPPRPGPAGPGRGPRLVAASCQPLRHRPAGSDGRCGSWSAPVASTKPG